MNQASVRQLKEAPGFIKGKLLIDRKLTFWTLTAWTFEKDMRSYRNSGAHLKAMAKLINWCDEATVVHWITESTELLGWSEAAQHPKRTFQNCTIPQQTIQPKHFRHHVILLNWNNF